MKVPTINIRAEFLRKDSENSDFRLDLDLAFVTMYSYLKTQDLLGRLWILPLMSLGLSFAQKRA